MNEAKNVDDLLVQSIINQPVESSQQLEETVQESKPDQETSSQEDPYIAPEQTSKDDDKLETESPIDEYGNPVEKTKTYTEEDLQRIVRERLARSKYESQQQSQQQTSQPKEETQTEDDWEKELNKRIDQRVESREKEYRDQLWKEKQYKKHMEWEDKFNSDMNKYPDFKEVVSGKPITDDMLIATKTLNNPGSFIYAASKLHAQELERISKIDDPDSQKFEIGRLHERMIKERKSATSTGKPLDPPKGDLPEKHINQPSIESRINDYAKSKRK
jgi:hypothetical protein